MNANFVLLNIVDYFLSLHRSRLLIEGTINKNVAHHRCRLCKSAIKTFHLFILKPFVQFIITKGKKCMSAAG